MARQVAKCGTRSGYNRHSRLKETSCDECKAANTEYYKEKYRNNPEYKERFLANQSIRVKEKYATDPIFKEKIKEKAHKDYVRRYADPEFRQELSENQKKWAKANLPRRRELTRKHSHIRRATILGNGHSPYTEKEVLDLYGVNCHLCNKPIDLTANRRVGDEGWAQALHIDHLIPILRGGADTLENVRPSHGLCNIAKGVKHQSA